MSRVSHISHGAKRMKAGETRDILPFILHELEGQRTVNPDVVKAGEFLGKLYQFFEGKGLGMSKQDQEQATVLLAKHIEYFRLCGGHLIPKHHYLLEGMSRLVYTGNPFYNHVYFDESFNGAAKKAARTANGPRAFSGFVLRKLLTIRGMSKG